MRAILRIIDNDKFNEVELSENTSIIKCNDCNIVMQEQTFGDDAMSKKLNDANFTFDSNYVVACGNGPYSIRYTTFNIKCSKFNIVILNDLLEEL